MEKKTVQTICISLLLLLTTLSGCLINVGADKSYDRIDYETQVSSNITIKWICNTSMFMTSPPIMKDINNDGIMEIFVCGNKTGETGIGRLMSINGSTGAINWQLNWSTPLGYVDVHQPIAVADLNNDGNFELVQTAMDRTIARHAENGTVFWNSSANSGWANLLILDINNDGYPFVYVADHDNSVPYTAMVSKLYGTNGTVAAEADHYYSCYGGVSAADLDNDGDYEILVSDRGAGEGSAPHDSKGIRCYDEDLNLLWNDGAVACSSHCAMLADVTGDGNLEVIVGDQNGDDADGIYVLDYQGNHIAGKCVNDLGLNIHVHPEVYDIDKDGHLEFITAYDSNTTVWDLTDWSLDYTDNLDHSSAPMICANVLGDSDLELIQINNFYNNNISFFDSSYNWLGKLTDLLGYVTVQDVDGDGLNEMIGHIAHDGESLYQIRCYDTNATALPILSDTSVAFYGQRRLSAEEYYDTQNWGKYLKITINHTYIDSALTNFPLLVTINSTVASCQDAGQDIRFYNNSNSTEFNYEIEEWNATENSSIWVNVTSISSSVDTVIWMRYNNSIASDGQNVTGTWNANFLGVYHMDGDNVSNISDSTSNARHAIEDVNTPIYQQPGQIGYSVYLNPAGAVEYIRLPQMFNVSYADEQNYTMECWKHVETGGTQARRVLVQWDSNGGAYIDTNISGNGHGYRIDAGSWVYAGSIPINNTWQYIVATFEETNSTIHTQHLYLNDSVHNTVDQGSVMTDWWNGFMTIGAKNSSQYGFTGWIDEVRFSNCVRNESWVNATFHSANQTTGFLSQEYYDPQPGNPPSIIINFAGNLSGSGGPYYRPPSESIQLAGVWSDGYYTNDSKQSEDWLYINLTVNDTSGVDNVTLHWLNETTWTNSSYFFINTVGDFWEFNSSGNITTHSGFNYSFDVWANDTSNNINLTHWNKTGAGETFVRRTVQLNNTASNFNYTPYYMWNASYEFEMSADRLHHDQPTTDASDRGYLLSDVPGSFVNYRYCALFVTLLYDEMICINSSEINNIYYHFWWSSNNNNLQNVGWGKERTYHFLSATNDSYATDSTNNRSAINWNNNHPTYSDNYFLDTHLTTVDSADYNFTDNEINQFYFEIANSGMGGNQNPTIISNRSFTSFILLNVPDNSTLQGQDTDSDNLNDYTELFFSYTNPFLHDTDYDGISDYWENLSGSDPNNYTETYNVSAATSVSLLNLTDTWNITWSGNSSAATGPVPFVTFCNSSGIRNETMNVLLTVNATQGIEWINVSVGDLKNLSNGWKHNASNITLWISGDNTIWQILQHNVGYGNGRFPDGGGNLTINESIWGVFPGNPWTYHGDAGIINENCSIYLRYQCNLTMDLNYGYYWNESSWDVYIGEDADTIDSETFTSQLQNGFEPMENCCLDVNKTVWNGSAWVKHYDADLNGQELRFNISFHNCGEDTTDNITVYDTHFDAITYYVPGTCTIKYPGSAPVNFVPNATSWEEATCGGYNSHGHITWHIPKENLTGFNYCKTIYIEYNQTINCSNYSKNQVGVYVCDVGYEWWDADCYNSSECYVNQKFNESIVCPSLSPEASNWSISEHINRPCQSGECYDEIWEDYETDYNKWIAHNSSDTWEWVYRYDNTDGNGTDALGLSYTLANQSDINRSMSLLRARYNISSYAEEGDEPTIGIIYAFANNSNYDMVLYGYDAVYLLSKKANQLVNTNDSTVVTSTSNAHNYYSSAWPLNTTVSPYHINPDATSHKWNGIWIKTLYNEHLGHLRSKAWQINITNKFALDYEVSGWIVNETLINTTYEKSKCFGLVVWCPINTTNFTADFDFIEEWRLNYSRDMQANASQLENHSIYENDGIPFINFPAYPYSTYQSDMWQNYYRNCYDQYDDDNITSQQFGDCSTCFYQNLSKLYNLESREFDRSVVAMPGQDNQKDSIYYYSTVMTNTSGDAPYNNSLYIQIEECTDGEEDSYDGAVVCIDVDNNMVWDDNDMAFYWYTVGTDVWYSIYNGTTSKYYDKTSSFVPGMEIWLGIDFTNNSYGWIGEGTSFFPPLHRYSPHRIFHINIPLYYLVKESGVSLNVNETFGLHIMTTSNDYEHSPVWENWNETSGESYTTDGNEAQATWTNYMNCTTWQECVDFEDGTWNGVTSTQMQYWAHGRIENTSGYLIEAQASINVTKEANVSTISNLAVDNIVNYTITICNDGDGSITNITVNDTLPENVEYVHCSLPGVNVTNPYDNYYIFNVTNESQTLAPTACISFNITVNFTAGCYPNGTSVTNVVVVTTNENANSTANVTIQYGTNKAPVITAHTPIFDRDGTSLLLIGMNITVTDANGDTMNISFGTNKTTTWTNSWIPMGMNLSVNNGTYQTNQTFNNSFRFNTKWRWGSTNYYWEVNVTDGKAWTNESYTFITSDYRQDVNTDDEVDVFDLSTDWANRDVEQSYLGIYDVNGDTFIDVFDLSNIWANKT